MYIFVFEYKSVFSFNKKMREVGCYEFIGDGSICRVNVVVFLRLCVFGLVVGLGERLCIGNFIYKDYVILDSGVFGII